MSVRTCVHHTVTTDALLVQAVETLKSPVETVSIQDECVTTEFPLEKFNTAPLAKNKSENCNAVVPNAAQSLLVGVSPVVIVADVRILLVNVDELDIVGTVTHPTLNVVQSKVNQEVPSIVQSPVHTHTWSFTGVHTLETSHPQAIVDQVLSPLR